jgi:hypothetical protein
MKAFQHATACGLRLSARTLRSLVSTAPSASPLAPCQEVVLGRRYEHRTLSPWAAAPRESRARPEREIAESEAEGRSVADKRSVLTRREAPC